MTPRRTLTFHLPSLGTVAPPLHEESAALYEFLESAGEIDRLKNLDHLGTIRLAWEGAHHSRWEYVMSILFLIERCARADTPEIHLKTRVSLGGTQVSSGEELLKCWALLANLGHLAGTFALERSLLFAVRDNSDSTLVAQLDPEVQPWATEVIATAKAHRFFQVLGFVRFKELTEATGVGAVSRRRWAAMMRALVVDTPSTDKLDELRTIYRNIRRLAFLALDSHYTPAISQLDLARLASDPTTLVPLILKPHTADDDLRGLERFLTHEIYLGKPVLSVIARHEWPLRAFFGTALQTQTIAHVVEQFAKPRPPDLLRRLEVDVTPVVRLQVWGNASLGPLLPRRTDVYGEQLKADAWAFNHKRTVRTIVWATAPGDEWVLQTHAPPDATADRAAAWRYAFEEACALHREMSQSWARWAHDPLDTLDQALFSGFASELLIAGLQVVFKTAVRWEFLSNDTPPPRLRTRGQLRAALQSAPAARTPSRNDERSGARHVLARRSGTYAAFATPIEAFQPSGRAKFAEFDAAFAQPEGQTGLALTVVEVKREVGGTGRSSAIRALEGKLRRFGLEDRVTRDPTRSSRDGNLGWASVTLRAR